MKTPIHATVLLLAILAIAADKYEPKVQTDKQVLQGTWEYVSAVRDGKPYKTPIGVRITFAPDIVTRKIGKKTHEHKYEIDPHKEPRQISLIATKDGKEEVSTGIYCLKGDTLTWCFNLPGKPIPEKLASKDGDGLTLCVLKRVMANQDKPASSITMPDQCEVELTIQHEGDTYKLVGGDLYRVSDSTDRLVFVDKIYDKEFREKNYATVEGRVYRNDTDKGKMYPTRRHFTEGFEGARQTIDLIGIDRGWTTFTLQSPLAPTVGKYNELRNRILRDGADFLDNKVEPSSEVVRSGNTALRCYSIPPSPQMTTAKASLSTTLLYFTRGDDVWFSGWYYVAEGGMPLTVMDLECTHFKEHPGMRIMVGQDGYVRFELKWARKPMYRQSRAKRVSFPTGRWVHLKSHLVLSEATDGVIQLWQDGVKLIDQHGQTLPLANAIYDSLEIGISAHSYGPDPATLFVDDVVISENPVR